MLSDIESAIKYFINSLQSLKMYGPTHPSFSAALDKATEALGVVFARRPEMIIGIVGEELAFEKEILFDLSKFLRPQILYLKERQIERIAFYRGLHKKELGKFVIFIARPKEEFKGDLQAALNLVGVEHITIGKLKVDAPLVPNIFALTQPELYDSSAESIGRVLSGVLNFEKIDHLGLKASLNNIMENLSSPRQEMLKLATFKRYDVETYTHMLNVAIFSMYFSSRLGFNKNNVLDIGVAALFHDIGKIYISRKTLHKSNQLSDQEVTRIKSHAVLGGEFMLKYVEHLGILPVVVSFEHHLKYDLSGYPRLPFLRNQHIASSIVSICDVYDALSQRRSYKQDYSADVVYNIMIKGRGTAFNPELFDNFFKFLGLWPVGSVVNLNDGSIALVKEQNDADIRRPKIQIVAPEDKKRNIDLMLEPGLSIAHALNPWKEGKEYLRLGES